MTRSPLRGSVARLLCATLFLVGAGNGHCFFEARAAGASRTEGTVRAQRPPIISPDAALLPYHRPSSTRSTGGRTPPPPPPPPRRATSAIALDPTGVVEPAAFSDSLSSSLSSLLLRGDAEVDPVVLAVAAAFGSAAVPLAESLRNATTTAAEEPNRPPFRETFAFQVADAISNAGRISLCAMLAPTVAGELINLGVIVVDDAAAAAYVARRVGFTIWAALSLRSLKRYALARMSLGHPGDFDRLGKISLYDRLFDILIFALAASFVLGELSVEVGPGIASIFTLGGIGTVAFSLASKDLAEQVVGGLLVSAWDAFEEGDCIKLGDGTEGTVEMIGLFESDIRGYDNVVIRIPNSQIIRQRVSNISRITTCQVRQKLRFRYSDRKKLPAVLIDIKAEIQVACPALITDGSRPFGVDMHSYEADHIEVIVNTHFDGIPPSGAKYSENRGRVLNAIGRAIDKNEVEFAIPSVEYVRDVMD